MATKDVGNLRTRLSWEDDGSARSLTRFKEDLRGLRSEMRTVTSQGKEYANSLKGLKQQKDILTRQMKTEKEQLKDLKHRYDEVVKAKGEDSKEARDLARQYNSTQAYLSQTEEKLKRVTQAIEEQQNPWKKLSDNMESTGKKMQDIGKGLTDFGKSYSMKVTAPIVASGTAVFKAAMDYESAFAGVRKTVDATEEQFAELSKGIREMSKELPQSANEIAGVAEVAGQLGIKREDILKFTRTMVDLGVATNMSSEEAATALARLANITQMPMENIDRLGATVVDLGNNLATTEAEIVEMGLRIAGAGSVVGMTEAQILSFSGALSSVGVNAEAGGSAISKLMINMANEVATGGKKLSGFAKVAGMSAKEFQKAFKEDAASAIVAFTEGLGEIDKAGGNVFGTLQDLGITEVRLRDSVLRLAGSGDVLRNSLKLGNKAWEENVALTNEAEQRYGTTESQLKIMWNRVKDVAITLGESLAPAVIDAIKAAEPFIKQIESGAKAFSELDEEQQRTILKMIGMVAAIGPASVALGGITTTIGGLAKGLGGVIGLFGRVGGAGLLGKIGMFSATAGPVGLAISGVGLLGAGIYALAEASQKSIEETYNSIQARKAEIDQMDELISEYEKLQLVNQLSSEEMLRYMDIIDELKEAKSEEAIKALKDEQAKLLEKSTLTNEEMQQFLELNDKIIEKSPTAAKAISEQGNAYAGVLDELKQLNEYERQRLTQDTGKAITDELGKQEKNLHKQKDLQAEINRLESDRAVEQQKVLDYNQQIMQKELEIAELQKEKVGATLEELQGIREREQELQSEITILNGQVEIQDEKIGKINNEIDKKQESLDKTNKELEYFNKLIDDYAQMVLFEQGITSEKGRHLEALEAEQKKIDDNRKKLEEMRKSGKLVVSAYNEQNAKLNEQQRKLDEAINKLNQMNSIAGQTIYQTVRREVRTSFRNPNNRDPVALPMYATGTDYHPGGPFIAGEEGFELGRLGNKWELLPSLGIYNRAPGYQIFPHDESKRIMQALNRLPAYADGAIPTGETNRLINQLNNQQQKTGEVVIYTTVINQMNGREISREIYRDVTEFQTRDREVRESFA